MSDHEQLKKLAQKLTTDGPVKVLPTPRLIQLLHNGIYIVKTTAASFVWEHPYYPQLYVPRSVLDEAVKSNPLLTLTETTPIPSPTDPNHTIATLLTLQVTPNTTPITKILSFGPDFPFPALQNTLKIDFESVDTWLQETTPIKVHPKDPFKRIEILPSARHIRVAIAGHTVADTASQSGTNGGGGGAAMHLYETGLPARYYLPLTSVVDARVLRRSETTTKCPYKGTAEYYSIQLPDEEDQENGGKGPGGKKGGFYKDVVWFYDVPELESAAIAGLVCFYNEKVDIFIDGVEQERPQTHFAKGPPNVKPPLF